MGLSELIFPVHCAGCRQPGYVLCPRCQQHLRQPPQRISRREPIGVPLYSFGPYSELRRNIIVAMKEYHNRELRPPIAAVLAAGLEYLAARGEIGGHCTLVPAPTRASSARRRGGDPVMQLCQLAGESTRGRPGIRLEVAPVLEISPRAADQSGLDAVARRRNMARAVRPRRPDYWAQQLSAGPEVVLVDDVVTTGATLAASVAALHALGAQVRAAVVFAAA